MSIVKFGSIVTSGSGSLGGATIQPFRSTHVLRKKPLPPKSRTPAQLLIRSYNKTMQAGWRSLAEPLQRIWNEYPKIHNICNNTGDKHPLSGHSLWMKYQYTYLSNLLPFLPNPGNYLAEPLGPELIKNGNFADNSFWSLNTTSFINNGTLFAVGPVSGREFCTQSNVFLNHPESYRVLITSGNKVGSPYWGNGASPWQGYPNGFCVCFFTPIATQTVFYVNLKYGTSIDISYISVKHIL